MLSPNINKTKNILTDSFNEIMAIDGFSYGVQNTVIGVLPKDPEWLAAVRSRLAMMAKAGENWQFAKPDIWSALLSHFPDYASAFAGVAQMKAAGELKGADVWIETLEKTLVAPLQKIVAATIAVNGELDKHYEDFKSIVPLLKDSIDQGWEELSDEEALMVKIAGALATLQAEVGNLEEQISSSAISGGKSTVTSAVSITYKLLSSAAPSVPYLSVASMAFTVGKTFYDIVSKTEQITEDLKEIETLQLEASEAAQAAAGTKAVLQLLYNTDESFVSIRESTTRLTTLWQAELGKLNAVVEALQSGADPETYFEILAIPAANANWQAINDYVQILSRVPREYGPPVLLEPGSPPSAGKDPLAN